MKAVCVASGPVLQVSRLMGNAPTDALIIAVLIGNSLLRIFQRDSTNESSDWLMLLELKLPQEEENVVSLVSVIAVEPLLIACVTVTNTFMILGMIILTFLFDQQLTAQRFHYRHLKICKISFK